LRGEFLRDFDFVVPHKAHAVLQYGRQLSALVIGDISGLKGESVRVGDAQGVLVSVECGKGGT
jgi:hypothetical protein